MTGGGEAGGALCLTLGVLFQAQADHWSRALGGGCANHLSHGPRNNALVSQQSSPPGTCGRILLCIGEKTMLLSEVRRAIMQRFMGGAVEDELTADFDCTREVGELSGRSGSSSLS